MTTLMTTVIGIILLSVVMVSAFVYFSPTEAVAIGRGPLVASEMSNLMEASESFFIAKGYYPLSIDDLRSEIEIESVSMLGGQFIISDNIACYALPFEENHDMTLVNAARDIPGSVVTNECGTSGVSGRRILAVSLDGVSAPVAMNF